MLLRSVESLTYFPTRAIQRGLTLSPRRAEAAPLARNAIEAGQKAGLVLEGQIQLAIGTQRIDVLAGDSFQFNSTLDHSVHNLTDKDALVLWIIAPQVLIHL